MSRYTCGFGLGQVTVEYPGFPISWALWLSRHSQPSSYSRRHASSSSSKRWQTRQGKDRFAINAKVQGLKSRAAFKLLEVYSGSCTQAAVPHAHSAIQINEKYRIFTEGQTIVDLVSVDCLDELIVSC